MINELLAAAILSTSFSVRTPNDDTKPLDYEFMVKAEKTEGNFTWSVKRDWERELGEKYEDNVWNFNQNSRILYGGLDYVNKESKDIDYITYNLGLHYKGLKIGLSIKENEPLLGSGFKLKAKKDDIEYNFNLSAKTDFTDNNIFNIKSEIKKWLTEKVNIFGLYKHEYYNKKEDFQFKVGLGVKL